jgi:hypothetical protein
MWELNGIMENWVYEWELKKKEKDWVSVVILDKLI